VLLAFVDESYETDAFFALGAVIVTAAAAAAIENGLDDLVAEWSSVPGVGLSDAAELHGYEVFHGKGAWASMPVRQRVNVYQRAMRVIGTPGARIALRGMDVVAQRRRYVDPLPPHDVVLGHLLESIDREAASRGKRVVVTADEVHTQERHRSNFRSYRRVGTPGYRSSRLPTLLDTLHFGPSQHSRLLQASDLVTYLWRRRHVVEESDHRARAASDLAWAAVEDAIAAEHVWRP
jgi:hypothetical protein